MAGDTLQHNIAPMEYRQELDYPLLGHSITNIAYKSPSVRTNYRLEIRLPAQASRSVRWIRGDEHFELAEIRTNAAYALSRIWLPGVEVVIPDAEEQAAAVDMYLFGDESVAKEGLMRIVHSHSKDTHTVRDFIRHAREIGTITQDGSRPRKLTPRVQEKQAFRRAIFSILRRPKDM